MTHTEDDKHQLLPFNADMHIPCEEGQTEVPAVSEKIFCDNQNELILFAHNLLAFQWHMGSLAFYSL